MNIYKQSLHFTDPVTIFNNIE